MGKGHDHLPIQNEIHILDNSKSISLWCFTMLCLFLCSHSFNQCFISYIPSENQPTIAKYVLVHNISDLLILFILILHFVIIF